MIHTCTQPQFPALVPAPDFCCQTDAPVICLNGEWKLLHTADYEQKARETGDDGYRTVTVPSWISPLHQPDFCGSYLYKTQIPVTQAMAASRVVLRMEGVNGFAGVYVNGKKLASHENSFVTWNVEITDAIQDCDSFELAITVDERLDKVSTFGHGGILHSVYLYLLPASYLSALHTTTLFDSDYVNATLRVDYGLRTEKGSKILLRTRLYDPYGNPVEEGFSEKEEENGRGCRSLSIPCPLSWDAEHPRLYTLEAELEQNGTILEQVRKVFGFRQLNRIGNRLYVNGKEVKLRGSCRHEVSAYNGRCLTPALIEEDVRLFKEANCNYIRTSHYPPSEYFLDLCDRYGIYVEDELALAFIARTLDYTQQDPMQTQRYLSHFAELASRDYSHPSVIIWSLCNESFGGLNFDLLNRFAKSADPTRVTKFSYPMTIREEYEPVDIWSIHYANYDSDLAKKQDNVSVGGAFGRDMPILHDEYVHVPCYNRTEHRRDPHVREFWGMSIARFWTGIWNTEGALGGAIWAGIDETDVYVGGNTCLEWGIIDIWRRKKPEHYGTRKAYSPVVLRGVTPLVEEIARERGEAPVFVRCENASLLLPVENRFCHTNLNETTVCCWYYNGSDIGDASIEACTEAKDKAIFHISCCGPDTPPFVKGMLTLPDCSKASYLYLEWMDACKNQVDEYLIPLDELRGAQSEENVNEKTDTPCLLTAEELPQLLRIFANSSCIPKLVCEFSRTTGLISRICRDGKPAITGGPVLYAPYLKLPDWQMTGFCWSQTDNAVQVVTQGSYGDKADVTFVFLIKADGTITIRYTIDALKCPLPPQIKLRVGVDCGGLDELGITLEAAPGTDRISWNRQGAYSIYPRDSIGRCRGTAALTSSQGQFGDVPALPWKEDCRHDILNGAYDPGLKGSNDFCGLKANLYSSVIASSDETTAPWQLLSEGKLHLRAEAFQPQKDIVPCTDSRIQYEGTWWPMTDSAYESSGHEMWSNEKGAKAVLSFCGTGIVWYAPVDVNYGKARVSIDGVPAKQIINQRIDGVDFPGSAAGFDKKYHYPVFSALDLEDGSHTLTIEVLGEHAADSCDSYIVLEEFYVLTAQDKRPVAVHLLKDYNYPHLAWGNWIKPAIVPAAGETNEVIIRV